MPNQDNFFNRLADSSLKLGRQWFGDQAVDQAMDQAGKWSGSASRQAKAITDAQIASATRQFQDALPFVEKAGYRVDGVDVVVGVTPRLVPHLTLVEPVSKMEREALLAEATAQGKDLTRNLLTSLYRAADLRKKLRLEPFEFCALEIEIGVLPNVIVKFRRPGDCELPDALHDLPETVDPLSLPEDRDR